MILVYLCGGRNRESWVALTRFSIPGCREPGFHLRRPLWAELPLSLEVTTTGGSWRGGDFQHMFQSLMAEQVHSAAVGRELFCQETLREIGMCLTRTAPPSRLVMVS